MDPPQRNLHASGIPRLSRLPLPRTAVKVPPPPEPTKYALKSQALPGKLAQNATKPTSVETDSATSQSMQQSATRSQTFEDPVANSSDDVQPDPPAKSRTLSRRPRPSLSDRTIETLSQIPPSPSPRRRRSSFFPTESPVGPSPRPASSLSRTRPSTSHGQRPPLPSGFPTPRAPSPVKRQLEPTTGNRMPQTTPSKRAASSQVPRSLPHMNATLTNTVELTPSKSKPPMQSTGALAWYEEETITNKPAMKLGRASQTLAARSSKQRPSVQGTFAKPLPKLRDKPGEPARATRNLSPTISAASTDTLPTYNTSSKTSPQTSFESAGPTSSRSKAPTSSAALRETIAKAKAARRKISQPQTTDTAPSTRVTDEFLETEMGGSNESLLRKRIASARADGRLNIAAMGLKDMPNEVLNMYNANMVDSSEVAWYESVDLVRLVAADNEFEHLGEEVFPDTVAGHDRTMEDDCQGSLFAGLDTVDLHGNHLQLLPLGLRRLEHLTKLNLSKNRLSNESLNVITQVGSIRELRLADNALDGMLTPQLSNLKQLETLDVSNNAITTLPPNSDEIAKLRSLNVAGNKLLSLPFELFISLPLVEIDAARNRLGGALFPSCVPGMPDLRALDVANNALSSIVESGVIALPSLQSLNVTENRLLQLPDMLGWTELLTLTTAGNRLASLPETIFSSKKLKNVDISRNDIKKLDERLGLMDTLAVLCIANNPLRERKFLSMDTDTLKRELRSRLMPEESLESAGGDIMSYQGPGPAASIATATPRAWHIKTGGVVERSGANLEAIEPSDLDSFIEDNNVKTLILHHNLVTQIPQAIELIGNSLRMLDLSRNKLTGSSCYILTDVSLPNLRSLNISNNAITSLSPLLEFLSAPQLLEINLSRNRLMSLAVLRNSFPVLTSVYASQNSISELRAESVKGLQLLDVSGNAIAHLDPKLGLLGSEGLKTLIVGANKFRVPRRDVIDKGTEAVLAWLKNRIPEAEIKGLG